MKKYPITELIKKWEREEITIEQAIGEFLLHIVETGGGVVAGANDQIG